MPRTVIDQMVEDHGELVRHLLDTAQPSLLNNSDSAFRKALTLAAASSFEMQVKNCVLGYVGERSAGDALTVAFVKHKALERQYHTLFSWTGTNANSFFGLFGPDFKQFMVARVKAEAKLDESIRAFLELGNLRNELAHLDFASYPMNKTVDEIYDLYRHAKFFIDELPRALTDFVDRPPPSATEA